MWGVAHIFASFNDTFVHVTDLSGADPLVWTRWFPPASHAGLCMPAPFPAWRCQCFCLVQHLDNFMC